MKWSNSSDNEEKPVWGKRKIGKQHSLFLLSIHLIPLISIISASFFPGLICSTIFISLFKFCFCKSSIEVDIWSSLYHCYFSSFYFSSIHYFCGYSLISHNFIVVDSINFKLVVFHLLFFFACADNVFISSKDLRVMLFPQCRYEIFSAFTYHSPRSCSPLHLGHQIARLVMTQKMLSEKSLQKKKVSPPSSTEAHPLLSVMIYNTFLWFTIQ